MTDGPVPECAKGFGLPARPDGPGDLPGEPPGGTGAVSVLRHELHSHEGGTGDSLPGSPHQNLTQIEGIDYINIYCGDQPLMDRQGNPVGMLSATDFIMNTSNVNAYEKTELTLYFADETGNRLVPEKREVVHNINYLPGTAGSRAAHCRTGTGGA